MTHTPQQNHTLTLLLGVVAALLWTQLGVRAIVTDNDPSVRASFVCAAMAFAGVALGSVMWILGAARRAKRPADTVLPAESSALLGIMVIGLGASAILDPSTSAWDWALLVLSSLLGGLNLGVSLMQSADRAAASGASRQSMRAPQ